MESIDFLSSIAPFVMALSWLFTQFLNYFESPLDYMSIFTTDGGYEDELEESNSPNPYHERQKTGEKWRKLIENTEESDSQIARSSLTFQHLDENESLIIQCEPVSYPFLFRKAEFLDGAPTEIIRVYVGETSWQQFCIRQHHDKFLWAGYTGPGVLIIENLNRLKTSMAPHVSEVIQAVYQRDYPLETLNYIFVRARAGKQTMTCILDNVNASGRSWRESGLHTWKSASPQYDAILGSPLGRAIAYFMLGAHERGARRIKQIHAWPQNEESAYVRFDIENCFDFERRKRFIAMARQILDTVEGALRYAVYLSQARKLWRGFWQRREERRAA